MAKQTDQTYRVLFLPALPSLSFSFFLSGPTMSALTICHVLLPSSLPARASVAECINAPQLGACGSKAHPAEPEDSGFQPQPVCFSLDEYHTGTRSCTTSSGTVPAKFVVHGKDTRCPPGLTSYCLNQEFPQSFG